jgi:guanylate kinase
MRRQSLNNDSLKTGKALLIILSGPSGVGKDAVLARMKEMQFPIHYIVTLTTRLRRSTEKDKVDYQFVSREEFLKLKENNELLESATVYTNYYGVPKKAVTDNLEAGRDVLIKVDVQGAETIKKVMPQAVAIFLSPPSKHELFTRLKKRSTESETEMKVRLQAAEDEFMKLPSFDYVVVNYRGEIDRAVAAITSIISIEKCGGTYNGPALENQLEQQG